MTDDEVAYRVFWSADDGEWVAVNEGAPSGPWLASDPVAALAGLIANGPKSDLDFIEQHQGDVHRRAETNDPQERAERLRRIQADVKAEIRAKHGRDLTAEELNALVRRVVKGE